MKPYACLLAAICCAVLSHAQTCSILPPGYYSINKNEFKPGDTVQIRITNKGKRMLYYQHCNDGCYFRCISAKGRKGKHDSILCTTPVCVSDSFITLNGKLPPASTIMLKCVLPEQGRYQFSFGTNTSLTGRRKWRCINLTIVAR